MVSIQGELPDDIVATAADIERRIAQLQAAVEYRLGVYATQGASRDELEALGQTADYLDRALGIGERVIDAIDDADIEEHFELDPEIDEEEMYNMVRRYADYHTEGFTVGELRMHLRRLGVHVTDDTHKLSGVFANWRAEIVADKKESGERVTWVESGKRQGQKVFVLARVVTGADMEKAEREAAVRAQVTAGRQPESAPPEDVAEQPAFAPAVLDMALEVVANNGDEKASKVVESLAATAGISVPEASQIYAALQASGRLHKVRREGCAFFSLEPGKDRARMGTERKSKDRVELGPQEKTWAGQIVAILAAPGRHLNMRMTPQELVNEIIQTDPESRVSVHTVKRIARVLERQNIMVQGKGRQGSKSPRSKTLQVFKVGLASQKVKDALKFPESAAVIHQLIESGEAYETPEE